ncbi:hypothetical protein FOCC_FOCC012991 [Frankliniella occidentalis]|nr:hypothetical protein FOCC_FOCC012991 [Frankliniella occidentalis]
MEAHLGRPKKNKQPKDKKGASKEAAPAPGAEGQTTLTDLPASSHLHRGPLTAESLDSISTCPTTGSERGGLRPHVNLSSPESAYSTGYSTDGTSPGASFPPEYYINLRTGTHYFHGPTPLPLPHPGPLALGPPPSLPPGLPPLPPALQPALNLRQPWAWPTGLVQQPEPPRLSYLTPGRSRKQQHQQQQHQQLLLEQQQQHLHLLQQQQNQHQALLQQQQLFHKQQQQQFTLSRTESSTEEDLVGKAGRPSSTSSSTLSSHSSARPWQPAECVSSPRARTRIRTNPWLPNSPAPTRSQQQHQQQHQQQQQQQPQHHQQQQHQQQHQQYPQQHVQQPNSRQALGCSSSLSLSSSSSYGSASDVSLQRRAPGGHGRARSRGGPSGRGAARPQPLFQLNEESPSVEDKPLPRGPAQPSPRHSPLPVAGSTAAGCGRASRASNRPTAAAPRSASSGSTFSGCSRAAGASGGHHRGRAPCAKQQRSSSSSSSASSRTANNGSPPNLSDNEDVEDVTLNEMMGKFDESYVYEKETDILSDSDPTDVEDYGDDVDDADAGDEQTDEGDLDFIDRCSLTEQVSCCEDRLVNRGHCSFHNFPPGRRQSSRRRSSRRETPSRASNSSRDASVGSPRGSRTPSERPRRRAAARQAPPAPQAAPPPQLQDPAHGGNLNRIVMQRLLLRSAELAELGAPGLGGTRSAGSTPLSARRHHHQPPAAPARTPHAEHALAEADREADRKYRQLIMQAEHILVSMTGGPLASPLGSVLPSRTAAPHYGTPPMSKRHHLPCNLNRRLDHLRQGMLQGAGPSGPLPAALAPSPLARDPRLNDNAEENRNRWSPLAMPRRALHDRKQCFTPVLSDVRRIEQQQQQQQQQQPVDNVNHALQARTAQMTAVTTSASCNGNAASPASTPGGRRRGPPPVPPPRTVTARAPRAPSPPPPAPAEPPAVPAPAAPRLSKPFQLNLQALPPPPAAALSSPNGWTAIEASSSDSDGCITPRPSRAVPLPFDRRAKSTATTPTSSRPPLVTYKSVDTRLDVLDVCPQSEPVKRKVYAGSQTLDRLSKKLEHTEIMPRTPVQDAADEEDARRKAMLMETLQQLKHSLETQSASLQVQA